MYFVFQMKRIEEARQVYERLVEQFPNAGKYWKIYIEQEVQTSFYICFRAFCTKLIIINIFIRDVLREFLFHLVGQIYYFRTLCHLNHHQCSWFPLQISFLRVYFHSVVEAYSGSYTMRLFICLICFHYQG